MIFNFTDLLKYLTPIERAYLITLFIHTSLGLFEMIVIWRTRYASINTIIFYLTSALVSLTQIMWEIHVKSNGPYFLLLFIIIFLLNFIYLIICLIYSNDKHTCWISITFLFIIYGIYYSIHKNILIVSNKKELIHVLLFISILANNFVPFDSLLAIITTRHRQCPPQWIPLLTGLLQSLFGGLYRHQLNDTLMAPADALGVAVHLFGLVVELQYQISYRSH